MRTVFLQIKHMVHQWISPERLWSRKVGVDRIFYSTTIIFLNFLSLHCNHHIFLNFPHKTLMAASVSGISTSI